MTNELPKISAAPVFSALLSTLIGVLMIGCDDLSEVDPPLGELLLELPPGDEVQQRVDAVLEATFERRLNLQDHATWQILHGVLAYQREFQVETTRGGELTPAVDHLLSGGKMNNWVAEPGIELDAASGRRGLRVPLDQGSGTGQGHPDQWLAVLSQCGLGIDEEIIVDGRTYSTRDWLEQVLWDVPRNVEREYSWTLIGLTRYYPTTKTWQASDGRQWSIEELVSNELDQELSTSACGGTHRMIGLAMTRNARVDERGRLGGIWSETQAAIDDAIAAARENQNPDGSFSIHYFARPGTSPDIAQHLGATGHVLEFLMLALDDVQLGEPWVTRAVLKLCDLFELTQGQSLECGALYHAAHALVLYRARMNEIQWSASG